MTGATQLLPPAASRVSFEGIAARAVDVQVPFVKRWALRLPDDELERPPFIAPSGFLAYNLS